MITLREETPNDFRETENVMREAFWNHYSPACTEHFLCHCMRDCSAFIPELSLVATDGQKIVGAVMSLKSYILGDDGNRYEVLSLGPIGVLPDYQRMGIGSRLIARSKEIAKAMGFGAMLLCGDPDYYTRQGFVAAERFGIRNAENCWMDALHACELSSGFLSSARGRYFEDEVYNVDETLAQEYDRSFPVKEVIVGTPMQQRFEMMVARVRAYK